MQRGDVADFVIVLVVEHARKEKKENTQSKYVQATSILYP
jgi:hypothetical protein